MGYPDFFSKSRVHFTHRIRLYIKMFVKIPSFVAAFTVGAWNAPYLAHPIQSTKTSLFA
jgi:hypothetical protein